MAIITPIVPLEIVVTAAEILEVEKYLIGLEELYQAVAVGEELLLLQARRAAAMRTLFIGLPIGLLAIAVLIYIENQAFESDQEQIQTRRKQDRKRKTALCAKKIMNNLSITASELEKHGFFPHALVTRDSANRYKRTFKSRA